MVKMTKLRVIQYYGNFSRTANQKRLRLLEERRGVLYRLSVLTLRPADQGQYVCKVQEISKHRNKWTAWSNGSSATEMRGESVFGISEEVQHVADQESRLLPLYKCWCGSLTLLIQCKSCGLCGPRACESGHEDRTDLGHYG